MISRLYIYSRIIFRYLYSIWNVKTLLRYGFKNKLTKIIINKNKKSDTLFVLGSGSSINKISKLGWKNIRDNDSIGLNYWPIHDFMPDFLMFEMPRGERGKFFYDVLAKKKNEYSSIPLIFKGLYKNRKDFKGIKIVHKLFPSQLIENMYLSYEISLPGRNATEFKEGLKFLDKRGFFTLQSNIVSLAQYRGTITCAIIFGIKAGYKNIVLCGVDLNDTKYFYEEDYDYYLEKGIKAPPSGQVGTIHKTNIKIKNVLPVSKAITLIHSYFKENYGVNILVSNKNSALYPDLEYYNLTGNEI